jgi:hypothetical protein
MSASVLIARGVGEEGFASYAHALAVLGVLDREELLGWLAFHGAVLRATEPPLDDGETLDEAALADLQKRLL